jgi:mannose-6-phosphate isomerase-like protein (cupin superfamily)
MGFLRRIQPVLEGIMDMDGEPRGAEKKEAFHQAAEAKVHTFSFAVPDVEAPHGRINCLLAGTNIVRSTILVIRKGYYEPAHYHPNLDGIWMVLKGRVKFYGGPDDSVSGVFGPYEGIVQPRNSRYWFAAEGDEEAWLLQISGFPKGPDMGRRVALDPNEKRERSVRVDLSRKPGA